MPKGGEIRQIRAYKGDVDKDSENTRGLSPTNGMSFQVSRKILMTCRTKWVSKRTFILGKQTTPSVKG